MPRTELRGFKIGDRVDCWGWLSPDQVHTGTVKELDPGERFNVGVQLDPHKKGDNLVIPQGIRWYEDRYTLKVDRPVVALVEQLGALDHEQWAHWTKHMLSVLEPLFDFAAENHYEPDVVTDIRRWNRQIETPYDELSEAEKESDREWALKAIKVLESFS